MKKALAVFVFSMIFLLAGCFGGDPVKDDLLNYVNKEMKQAVKLEAAAVSAYEGISGANFKDDQTMYDGLTKEVIPNYTKLISELNSVSIKTDEVKAIHEIFIKGADIQLKALEKVKQAIEDQDSALIEEANDMLADAEKLLLDYKNKLYKLAKEHDVKIKK
ncbi:lipoprotein [Neobacillus vireti]|uniref:Lipoprotein n=1 Tax=Neobacillus vireti LMG 21834 TaxID=1131730 RepID=A0AB94IUL0_9BACI|nr:lipoprotein [Neobacillus vireti]ETI70740.1 Lipoprotein [Neobacillus vireti LMG 21834]KLT18798.1 lipoprotein [Neobacillus vireti]